MKQWREWNTDPPSAGARRFKQRAQREHLVTSARFAGSLSLYRARESVGYMHGLGHLAYQRGLHIPSLVLSIKSTRRKRGSSCP